MPYPDPNLSPLFGAKNRDTDEDVEVFFLEMENNHHHQFYEFILNKIGLNSSWAFSKAQQNIPNCQVEF